MNKMAALLKVVGVLGMISSVFFFVIELPLGLRVLIVFAVFFEGVFTFAVGSILENTEAIKARISGNTGKDRVIAEIDALCSGCGETVELSSDEVSRKEWVCPKCSTTNRITRIVAQ